MYFSYFKCNCTRTKTERVLGKFTCMRRSILFNADNNRTHALMASAVSSFWSAKYKAMGSHAFYYHDQLTAYFSELNFLSETED